MKFKHKWTPLLRVLLIPALLLALVATTVLPTSTPVMAASVVENLYYDLATISEAELLNDWNAFGDAERSGITITSASNTKIYTRTDVAMGTGQAFMLEAVVSADPMGGAGERGARMWAKFVDPSAPAFPSGVKIRHLEVQLLEDGVGSRRFALIDAIAGTELVSIAADWSNPADRYRVRLKRQQISGSNYMVLQAEKASEIDDPDDRNPDPDTPSSQKVLISGLQWQLTTANELGFGHHSLPTGDFASDWVSIHVTGTDSAGVELPYWPVVPPAPTLVHDDKGMDSPQGIDFSCDLTSSGYLTNDSVTPELDADGTTYYGETRLNPGSEVWDFDGLSDDQTVYGRVVATDVSGRSTIGPDGTTIIPDRTTPAVQQIDDILTFFDDSVADGTLVGSGPGNSAKGRLGALRNMIEAAGDLINQGCITEACLQLQNAYDRVDGQPKPPDFASGSAVAELANMIQQLINSLGG